MTIMYKHTDAASCTDLNIYRHITVATISEDYYKHFMGVL